MSFYNDIKCETNGYKHNSRCRYTHGYLCEDCYRFIPKGSLEFFVTEEITSIWMVLRRGESEINLTKELEELKDLVYHTNRYLRELNKQELESERDRIYGLLRKHNLKSSDCAIILK